MTKKSFEKPDQHIQFPKMEEEILTFWDQKSIFKKTLDKTKGSDSFVFYEGPPTANGKPGIHHVLARAFKDIIPRFKTMQGFYVSRKAGWDTHGLPVELEVEKRLKISGKPEIEKYGIEEFNTECKKSVWEYKDEWEKLTKRIAFWLDLENPYVTYSNEYIESLWWIIKQIYDKGLLYEGHKVVPHCPRCGTALSSHEVAQGYKDVTEPSVYVKFKVKDEDDTYILSWTTTPWTLPGNVALAVGADLDYVKAKKGDETYILAKSRLDILDDDFEVIEEMKGSDLEGIDYEPLFDSLTDVKEKVHYVTTADFVTTDDGSGVVHTAVMYGDDDYRLGEEKGLPKVHTVDENGNFNERVKEFTGMFVKDAEKDIANHLKEKGLLLKKENYTHSYPFCWRCDTPLLYYAKASWFIKTSAVKDELLKNNEQINWIPEHIKHGRFGKWLENVKDWALSRERYWGTPLPIWKCVDCKKTTCVGGYDELSEKSQEKIDLESFDVHRPYVDEIKLTCECGGEMVRETSVLDCWFDSGSMPLAQHHYPFENKELVDNGAEYPADYISEAIDQTRGWFYTLLAVSTVLGKGTSYKNVICLGHINDKNGKKMSKSKGNVIDPWVIINQYGVDALRWYLYTINAPGEPKRFDPKGVEEVVKNVVLKQWNLYTFFATYAGIDNFEPKSDITPKEHILDRWILSHLETVKAEVTEHLEHYNITEACSALEKFIDDLSNWYVRRSRRRFWKSENDTDKLDAYETLHYCLLELTKLEAPFMPFIADKLYQGLLGKEESVHLETYPKPKRNFIDSKLNEEMSSAKTIVTLGHAARDTKQIKVRQPLANVFVLGTDVPQGELLEIVKDELNVKSIQEGSSVESVLQETVKLKFNILGKKYGGQVKEIQKAVQEKNYELKNDKTLEVGDVILLPEEYERVYESTDDKYAVASERDSIVVVDTEITKELEEEGIARELVRHIQEMRKEAGYEVSDRIMINFKAESDQFLSVLEGYTDYIKRETLAEVIGYGNDLGEIKKQVVVDSISIDIGVTKIK